MKKQLPILVFFLVFGSYLNAQFTWLNKQSFTSTARMKSTAFAVNGYGYVVGGRISTSPVTFTNDVQKYDPVNDSWSTKANYPIIIGGSSSFVIDNYAYVVGGTNNSLTIVSSNYQYNPATDTFISKAPYPGNGITTAVGFTINGKGYIGSGTHQGSGTPTTDFYEYDPIANTWASKAAVPGSARVGAVGFAIGNFGFIGLGTNGAGAEYTDFYKYDQANNSWTAIAQFPGKGRQELSAFVINGIAYLGGGFRNISANYFSISDYYAYDPEANTWTSVPGLPGAPRGAFSAFDINGSGYVVNGYEWDGDDYYTIVNQFTECSNVVSHLTNTNGDTQEMKLYPNPTTEELNVAIDGTVTSKLEYEIYAIDGKLIKNGITVQNSFRVSTREMADGVYLFNMKDGNTNYTVKRFEVMH